MELEHTKQISGMRLLVGAAAIIVVVAGLKAGQALLMPFLFAIILSVIALAPVNWLKKKGAPNWLAVLAVTAMIVLLLGGLWMVLSASASSFIKTLPYYQVKLGEIWTAAKDRLVSLGFDVPDNGALSVGALDFGKAVFAGLFAIASKVLFVVVVMIFLLTEADEFRQKSALAFDSRVDFTRTATVLANVQRYLGIKTITSAITGVLVALWVLVMGVDFVALWGLLAFVLNYVPFVGSIIAAIPAVLIALVHDGLPQALTLGVGYIIINVGVSNFLEPVLMGRRLGLSALVVFLSLVFWGWVWGPAGMLISVPLTMIVKNIFEQSTGFQWVALLMGPPPKKEDMT